MTQLERQPVASDSTAQPSSPLRAARDVIGVQTYIVNLYFVGEPGAGDREWVLVDAGMYGGTWKIVAEAERLYGPNARPSAIVLTHGHFDHVGGLPHLAERWGVPVYAHPLELPYLTGRSAYPPPDPTVGGGMMARLSMLYPRGPYDFRPHVRPLPADGSVPGMPGWRWVHTPGHTPGHVSLFRDADRVLIAGDALVTTKQESAVHALTQIKEIHGPPMYFTPDWGAARRSVQRLADLRPSVAATGHGLLMRGDELLWGLDNLAAHFDEWAVPRRGRYVRRPAVAGERGVEWVPPPVPDPFSKALIAAAAGLAAVATVAALRRRDGD